jgi:hypothetical protein
VDQPVTWSYDDVALTITYQAGAATGCAELTTVSTFDTNSLFVGSTTIDANGTRTSTDTILDTITDLPVVARARCQRRGRPTDRSPAPCPWAEQVSGRTGL